MADKLCAECNKIAKPMTRGLCHTCSTRRAYWANPAKARTRAYQRAYHLQAKYGLTVDDYDAMLLSQGSRCAICGVADPGVGRKRFCVDHNHACCPGANSCGKCVRKLLCTLCNSGLALFRDNPAYLRSAATYLEEDFNQR